eukprot:CAMPEP_0185745956 /NCGR_PEP_ID=MMETSP1174-20130828/4344_1 /TAXON_ID=35687 /ORGANISM="Dictyocha speculum, Strain CCMP1381" /LENGTH=348 /DNA_ID=CAMNT_0028420263 /DNA_START=113 /DNA_END=1156 /DNA_ORIENTATION=-
MVYHCIIIASSDLIIVSRILEGVETLVTTNGGVHYSSGSLPTQSDMDRLLAVHPILSISTEFDELGKLGNFFSSAAGHDEHLEHTLLQERLMETRKELLTVSRNMSNLLWDWIPKHVGQFETLRAHQFVDSGDFSVGGHFGEYMITGEIGSGCSGVIFSCSKRDESRSLALKVINKKKLLTTKSILRAAAEIHLLHGQAPDDLHRRNILPILEVVHSRTCMSYTMEQFGTNLLQFSRIMNEGTRVYDTNTMKVATAIRDALQHIHTLGYAHRDVKGENILVRTASENSTLITGVRLIDFGIVCRLDDEVSCRELCGTPGFIAPEVIWRQVEDARKADVWSLGCVVLER